MLCATFKLNDGRLRINVPVIKKNEHTVWVRIVKKPSGKPHGKPVDYYCKRHIIKDNVVLSEG